MTRTPALRRLAVPLLLAATHCGNPPKAAETRATPAPVPLKSKPRAVEETNARFVAVIAAQHTANVTSQVEGVLRSVDVRLGDFVAEGQALASVDDRSLKDAVAAARAAVEVRGAEARVAAVRARKSASDFERQSRLQREGLVSVQEREAALSARAESAAELQKAHAAAREATAELSRIERSLEWSVVRAPVAGLVATRFVDAGNEVRRGDPIVRIVSKEKPWIRFAMPATFRDGLRVGDAIEFTSIEQKLVIKGSVSQIAPDADPLSELVIAEATFSDAADTRLYPGLGGYVSAAGARPDPRSTHP